MPAKSHINPIELSQLGDMVPKTWVFSSGTDTEQTFGVVALASQPLFSNYTLVHGEASLEYSVVVSNVNKLLCDEPVLPTVLWVTW